VGPGYHERVPVEDRSVVQERDELLVVKDDMGGDLPADDLVENAIFRGPEITLCVDMAEIPLGSAPPETVLPGPPPGAEEALTEALSPSAPPGSLLAVAGRWPRYMAAWAALSEQSDVPVTAYAYARTGYHRGLDALRAAGWRGSGYVRWRNPSNRGFLRCVEALRLRAGEIGEADEEQRCALFLRQLDPDWERRGG
jgi:hypothetical protein